MPYVQTEELSPGKPTAYDRSIYNALDCCITLEVLEKLSTMHGSGQNTQHGIVYQFERALQAPLLEMMLRGVKIDELERRRAIDALEKRLLKLDIILQQLAVAVWDKGLNPNSPKQLIEFFYTAFRPAVPQQFTFVKGKKKLSTNREALEKIEVYLHPRPIVSVILKMREIKKELDVLRMGVDQDGRMRTSFNITTETGRLSSSQSCTGSGGNLQNLKQDPAGARSDDEDPVRVRKIFQADKDHIFVGIDLEQAESREVGWLQWILFADPTYLNACYGGDLHSQSARLIWPELPWTGDLIKDRVIAEQPFYRQFSYRDMSKRGGHATSYYATAWTIARHLKIPLRMAESFQDKFFTAYPAFSKWHKHTAKLLQIQGFITTPFGRTRHFFGRRTDDTTLREAIAFSPQSSTADRMNLGLWRVWKHLGTRLQLLLQIHDAIYFQVHKDENLAEIVKTVLSLIDIRLAHNGMELIVPGEPKTGWNLSNYHEKYNPNGLKKWKGAETRSRLEGINRVL